MRFEMWGPFSASLDASEGEKELPGLKKKSFLEVRIIKLPALSNHAVRIF